MKCLPLGAASATPMLGCNDFARGDPKLRRELPPAPSVSVLAELGALIGDPARTNMLLSLRAQGEMSARQLADAAGVAPQTASGHLAKLTAAALVRVEKRGRYHFYRLGSVHVTDLLDAVHLAGASLAAGRERGTAMQSPHLARICRDHMAGPLAVALAAAVLDDNGTMLARQGLDRLARWGLADREWTWGKCLDHSEGAHHFDGSLGAALMAHAQMLGWIRFLGPNELIITASGWRGFQRRFGIELGKLERAQTPTDRSFLGDQVPGEAAT